MEDTLGVKCFSRSNVSPSVLILILMEKMNTQSQRAGGHLNLLANVGIISGKERFVQKSCMGVVTSKTFIKFAEYMIIPSAETETGRIEENILCTW